MQVGDFAVLSWGSMVAACCSLTIAADLDRDRPATCAAYFQIVAHCASDSHRATPAAVELARAYQISARDIIKARLASFPATAVLLEHKALADSLFASVKGGCADLPDLIQQQGEGCKAWLIRP